MTCQHCAMPVTACYSHHGGRGCSGWVHAGTGMHVCADSDTLAAPAGSPS